MLLAAFSAGIYSVFGRPTFGRRGPMFVTALAMVFGVLALLPLAAASGAVSAMPQFTRHGWIALVFLGVVGGAIQFSLFTWALRWLPPTRTVIYLALNPISAMLLATLALGEAVAAVLIVGLVLVISGILVANWPATAAGDTSTGRANPRMQEP
jgi:drug/metabolite transporter (DMT)-like permease